MPNELVPLDQPYGERQKFQDGMRTAGVSTSLPAGQQPTPTSALAQTPKQGLGFDPLLDLAPIQPSQEMVQPSFRQRLEDSVRTSPNPLMREAARRILGDQ